LRRYIEVWRFIVRDSIDADIIKQRSVAPPQ
jgi:hypothetical protein